MLKALKVRCFDFQGQHRACFGSSLIGLGFTVNREHHDIVDKASCERRILRCQACQSRGCATWQVGDHINPMARLNKAVHSAGIGHFKADGAMPRADALHQAGQRTDRCELAKQDGFPGLKTRA